MKSFFHLSFLLLHCMAIYLPSSGQNKVIDSLKKVLNHQQPDTNKALTYVRISEQYLNIGDANNLIQYADSAIDLSRKLSFKRIEASGSENRGFGYLQQRKFDSAKKDFLTGLDIRKEIGNKTGIAQSYYSLGQYYNDLDSLPEALENYYRALEISEELGDKYGVSSLRNILSRIYLNQGNDSDALINTQLAVNLQKEVGYYDLAANSEQQMGIIEFDRHNYDKAMKHYLDAIQMAKDARLLDQNSGYIFMLIGDVYQKQGELEFSKGDKENGLQKYRQAMMMYDSTAKKYIERKDSGGVTALGIHIAKIYIHDKQFSKARKLLDAFIKHPQYYYDETDLGDAYASLSVIDSAEGNYKDAYLEYKTYIRNRDSVSNFRNNNKLFRVVMQHEYDVREAEAKVLQAKKDAAVRESRNKQNLAIVSLALVVVAILVIALIQMRNNKAKLKANKLLEKTLSDLKSTQTQLIQSEKLASLGELTAGIAHEIQNPLNFVNNFSEVSGELVAEMKDELKKGNTSQAAGIADDIERNLEKINYHGKRADAIVKGMLLHSRRSTGQKEPTDINALAEEYFRLSYQGMRARDKSFVAGMQTDFDNAIGKINIIPQDIGRVLLNLYNNAFYAVNEKTKLQLQNYEPMVYLSTKKLSDKIEIRIQDNGMGIPEKNIAKIFQPFFTTKPTGEGTGLGLSLSYDTIKAHGGELKVETKEGEYTTFVVVI